MSDFRITDAAFVPEELKSWIEVYCQWSTDRRAVELGPDEAKIRAALDEKCERCSGLKVDGPLDAFGLNMLRDVCAICHGSGLRQIPGVERVKE